jgi:hypothetical protein
MPPKKRLQPDEEFQFEVLPAQDMNPDAGVLIVVAGPPGTGKSWFLGQMCQEGPTLLIATLAREASSWQYQQHNPDVILLEDTEWEPLPPGRSGTPRGSYVANAFLRSLDIIEALATDELVNEQGEPYKVVLIDSGTEWAEAGWHEALMPFGVMDPAYMRNDDNRFGPYTALDGLLTRGVKAVQRLKTAPTPKHIGLSWHVQAAKEDTTERVGDKQAGYTLKKQSADHRAEGIEYEGSVLPMVRGQFRRRLFGLVDAFVWTDIHHDKKRTKSGKMESRPAYVIQAVSDEERICKVPGPLPADAFIPNDWPTFKKLLGKKGQ